MKKKEIKELLDETDQIVIKNFGKKVKLFRLKNNLSQSQLANISKIHYTYISSIERGCRNVSIINVNKLAKALKCASSDLLEII